jgi:carbon-monoxide dehydrogenase medium subunit
VRSRRPHAPHLAEAVACSPAVQRQSRSGGQSLVQVLGFRLATPSLLVYLRRLPGMGDIVVDVDPVPLGAPGVLARCRGRPAAVGSTPAVSQVPITRSVIMARFGGSLAHAHRAAEL